MRCAPRITTIVALVVLAHGPLPAAAAGTDYVPRQLPRPAAPADRVTPLHAFLGATPAYWPQPLHWRYNHAGAPGPFSDDEAATVQQLIAASRKWMDACGVAIVYDGETVTAPNVLISGRPDLANVAGWQVPEDGFQAATHYWTDVAPNGDGILVDADISLSPTTVTSPEILASIITHEWGHAIGLGHSPVADTVMSGPPDSAYTGLTELTPDDVQGCRCLYGPPLGVNAGYSCSLPSRIDFGTVTVGTTSPPRDVELTNDGSASMILQSFEISGLQGVGFAFANNQCGPGTTLVPGASCGFKLVFAPTVADIRRTEAIINTSEGPYRIPLRAEGVAPVAPPPPPPNFEGAWWHAPAGSESGWGITLAHQGDSIFAAWYTYDASGKAWWLTMTAVKSGVSTYGGTLFRTTGPAFDATPFDPGQVQRIPVGNGTLTFANADNGTFEYTVNGMKQSKAINRFAFGSMPTCTFGTEADLAPATNFQGDWWAAGGGESGWGIYFTHQGDALFVSWFTYDLNGSPVWLSATATKIGNGVYRGDLIETSGPPFNADPFDPQQVARTRVGTLTLTFADGNNARLDYTVTRGSPQVNVTGSKQLTRFLFASPPSVCR